MQPHVSTPYIPSRLRTESTESSNDSSSPSLVGYEAKTMGVKLSLHKVMPLAPGLFDFAIALSLVFGGCCTNAWTLERVLNQTPSIGATLTFAQMAFIALQSSPSFIEWRRLPWFFIPLPALKPRAVPFSVWALQVVLVSTISFLNNLTYRCNVPLSIQIVLRSAGLIVSMTLGFLFSRKRYSRSQLLAALMVTIGVLTTTTRPTHPKSATTSTQAQEYMLGIVCLGLSLLTSGCLGLFQERTFARYGPHWKEGVFYTHTLSLPIIGLMWPDIARGWRSLATSATNSQFLGLSTLHAVLAVNIITQAVCVSGVNNLTSKVSSVTTNLVLTARKAASLCLSVWWFGSGVSAQLALGATFVFTGTILYGHASAQSSSSRGKKVE